MQVCHVGTLQQEFGKGIFKFGFVNSRVFVCQVLACMGMQSRMDQETTSLIGTGVG